MTGVFHKYLELIEVRPKLRKLKEILSETPYTEDSKKAGQLGPSFHDLLEKVQASEKELKEALQEFECLELDGMWFILDQDYQMKVLSYILRFVSSLVYVSVMGKWICFVPGSLMKIPGSLTVYKKPRLLLKFPR